MQVIRFNLYDFLGDSLLEFRHRLITIPEDLRWAVFENIIFVIFDSDHAIRQHREADIGPSDNSILVGDGLESGNRWKRHKDSSIMVVVDCKINIPSVTKL